MTIPRLGATSLWLDESISMSATHNLWQVAHATGGTMVLFYALLTPWVWFGHSVWWMRVLPMCCALATLPIVGAIGRRVGGRRVAALAPVLTSLSFMFDSQAADLRAYALETFLVTVAFWSILRAVEVADATRVARRWWALAALCAALAVLAHGLAVVFAVTMVVWALGAPRPRRELTRALPVAFAAAAVFATLAAIGLSGNGTWARSPGLRDVVGVTRAFTSSHTMLTLTLVVIGLVGATCSVKKIRAAIRGRTVEGRQVAWHAALPLLWTLAPPLILLVGSVVRSGFVARFLSPISPGVGLLVALGAVAIDDRLRTRLPALRRWQVVGPAVVCTVAVLAVGQPAISRYGPIEDWRGTVRTVDRSVQPGDGIVFVTVRDRPTFEAAWYEHRHRLSPTPISPNAPLGWPKRFVRYDSPATIAVRSTSHRRIWVVYRNDVAAERAREASIVTEPAFRRAFTKSTTKQFRGGISVVLYLRK